MINPEIPSYEELPEDGEVTPEVIKQEFDSLKTRLGSFYECPEYLAGLELRVVGSSDDILSKCEQGNLEVSHAQVEDLHDELHGMGCNISEQEAYRFMIGVGIAGVITITQLSKFAAESKHDRYAEQLKEFFANHYPIDEAFGEIFNGDFASRARMTEDMYDDQAMDLNGLRYRIKLLTDAYKDSEDHDSIPDRRFLTDQARKRIFDMSKTPNIFTDVSVLALGRSIEEGDKIFFQSLSSWLVALACPVREAELSAIHSEGWKES